MASDAELLADRRVLRRRLSGWRLVALAAVLVALVLGGVWAAGDGRVPGSAHIARVSVSGVITGNHSTIQMLERLGKSNAKAVLVVINSPGGTTSGSEAMYDALRRLSATKPTVAVIDSIGASGAYITALGTDRIFARQTSLVGSIGVLIQFPNIVKLMDMVGVKMEEVKSSPLKAAPNSFEPVSPEARAAVASLVANSYDWFRKLVGDRRKLGGEQLTAVADGRVFTGSQALGLKLIDQLGGEREAVGWLEANRAIPKDLSVRDWKPDTERGIGLLTYAANLAGLFGFDGVAGALSQGATQIEASRLDGVLALWQVQSEK